MSTTDFFSGVVGGDANCATGRRAFLFGSGNWDEFCLLSMVIGEGCGCGCKLDGGGSSWKHQCNEEMQK